MKLGDERFRVVTGGAHGMADMKWFADHLPDDGSAQIADLTSAWTTLGLWGPRARDILASLTADDVSNEALSVRDAAGRSRSTPCACSRRASRTSASSAGSSTCRWSKGAKLWDLVWEAGEPHGVVPAGIGVYGTTGRLEKCYRAFGFELDADYNVVEAGMAWGRSRRRTSSARSAHVAHRESEPVAVLCTLTVDDHTLERAA